MSVKVIFECGGCNARAESYLGRRFESLSGRSCGVGRYVDDRPQDVVPQGWIAFDPYTFCCYCPACWAEIMAPQPQEPLPAVATAEKAGVGAVESRGTPAGVARP